MHRFPLILAIVFSLVLFGLNSWLVRMPDAQPRNVPENQFSAERAIDLLKHLLGNNTPHPVGSSANAAVQTRITDWLDQQKIVWEIQSTWSCAFEASRCSWVENIIATLPGKTQDYEKHPFVALMAHYDSVPMAPGAGDDGAGVVTLLEVARILKLEGPANNPLMLIFTDAEEIGLMGAEAFFNYHPLAKNVGMVINIEGGGTSGHSQVLRTAFGSRLILSSFTDTAKFPFGNSIANEMFKRMPNDTDFSVSMRSSIPGIDFAFASELNHYHTPNDSTENLNPRSVQHHGENALPLTRALLQADLTNLSTDELAYSQSYGLWLDWSDNYSVLILILAISLLLLATFRFSLFQYPKKELLFALLGTLSVLLTVIALGLLLFKCVSLVNETVVSWPANDWPFRTILFFLPVLGVTWLALFFNRLVSIVPSLFATWWWWVLFASLLTYYVPGASGPLLIPLLASAGILLLASFIDKYSTIDRDSTQEQRLSSRVHWMALLTLVFVVPNTVSLVLALETTQGYGLIVATFPLLSLFAIALFPLARGVSLKVSALVSSAVVVLAMALAVSLPLYSAWRPQHVNIYYSENLDDNTARVQLKTRNPAPERMLKTQSFNTAVLSLFPWDKNTTTDVAELAPSGWNGVNLQVMSVKNLEGGRLVEVTLQAQRPIYGMFLLFDETVDIQQYSIDGYTVQAHRLTRGASKGAHQLYLFGAHESVVKLKIDIAGKEPAGLYLADVSSYLPDSLLETFMSRPPLASPVHQGDLAVLYRRLEL